MGYIMGFISMHYGYAADAGDDPTFFDTDLMNRVSNKQATWAVSRHQAPREKEETKADVSTVTVLLGQPILHLPVLWHRQDCRRRRALPPGHHHQEPHHPWLLDRSGCRLDRRYARLLVGYLRQQPQRRLQLRELQDVLRRGLLQDDFQHLHRLLLRPVPDRHALECQSHQADEAHCRWPPGSRCYVRSPPPPHLSAPKK